MDNKFKANPYNSNNKLILEEDIINIFHKLNINDFKTNNIKLYQTAFVHKSNTDKGLTIVEPLTKRLNS